MWYSSLPYRAGVASSCRCKAVACCTRERVRWALIMETGLQRQSASLAGMGWIHGWDHVRPHATTHKKPDPIHATAASSRPYWFTPIRHPLAILQSRLSLPGNPPTDGPRSGSLRRGMLPLPAGVAPARSSANLGPSMMPDSSRPNGGRQPLGQGSRLLMHDIKSHKRNA